MATSTRTTRAKTATPRKKAPTKAQIEAQLAETQAKLREFEAAEKRRVAMGAASENLIPQDDVQRAIKSAVEADRRARVPVTVEDEIENAFVSTADVEEAIEKDANGEVNLQILQTLVELQQQVKAQADELAAVKARPKKKRSNVGKRTGDKIIRNTTSRNVNIRLGNPKDPYRIELKPRGQSGDIADVPASLVAHTAYRRNFGRVFEEISTEEAEAIRYGGTSNRDPVTVVDGANSTVFRGKDVGEDPRARQVGPNQVQFQSNIGPRQVHQTQGGNIDPEYAEFLNWKRQTQQQTPQTEVRGDEGYDPLAGVNSGSLADRLKRLQGDPEGSALLRYYQQMINKGTIDEKELLKPVTVEYSNQTIQPIDPDHIY